MPPHNIPVCMPRLPLAEHIMPYLKRIDVNRWYTNFGPLLVEFTTRLASLFGVTQKQVTTGSNATILLELTLKSLSIEHGTYCIVPSWTFAASPLAIINAHLRPLFVDVDIETQTLHPERLLNDLQALSKIGKIGAVMVIAPFGQPVNVAAWDDFTTKTGIPVIIDAAAAFDSILQNPLMTIGHSPLVVSLHATKVFGIGEGGLVLSTNENLILRIENLTQFGFPKGMRDAYFIGSNAKLSEYVAAVGLAALDNWLETRSEWLRIANDYICQLNKAGIKHMLSEEWAGSVCNVILPQQSDTVLTELAQSGIQARKWWGNGCHHQPAFQQWHVVDLANTEYLQQSILGLPFYLGMTTDEIARVVNDLTRATD